LKTCSTTPTFGRCEGEVDVLVRDEVTRSAGTPAANGQPERAVLPGSRRTRKERPAGAGPRVAEKLQGHSPASILRAAVSRARDDAVELRGHDVVERTALQAERPQSRSSWGRALRAPPAPHAKSTWKTEGCAAPGKRSSCRKSERVTRASPVRAREREAPRQRVVHGAFNRQPGRKPEPE